MANKFTVSTVFKGYDQTSKVVKNISRSVGGLNRALNFIKAAVIGRAVVRFGSSFVAAAADVEKYKTTLTTMLGSAELANKRFEEMSRFAAATPFELDEVVQLGNQLQALGRYSEENMTILGDLASAAGKPIDQATRAFAKLASGQKGIAVDMFRDLLITTQDWVKFTGKGVSKSGQMLATTEEMLAALPKILGAKGFSGMMAQQSKTWNGMVSNMKDNLTRLKAGIGEAMLGPLKEVVAMITRIGERAVVWVQANKEIIGQRIQGTFKAIGGALRFIAPYAKSFFEILGWLKDRGILKWVAVGIVALTVAQWGLNAAMAANPVGAVIAALVALVAIVIIVRRHWAEITEFLRNSWNKVNEIFNKPGVQIALMMVAQPLLLILNTIRTIIDLLSGRGWKSFANMAGPWKTLTEKLGITKGWAAGRWNRGAGEAGDVGAGTPMTPNAGMIESRSVAESRSTVDVNLNNLPRGTTVKQSGKAPGFTLNTGYAWATGQGQGGLW